MSKPIKIVKVLLFSEPGNAGVKRHVLDILNQLHGNGFEFSFVYSLRRMDAAYPAEIECLREKGVRCYELPITSKPEPLRDLSAAFKFMGIVRKEKPDLIHCHSSKAGFIGRIFGKLAAPKTPILFTPNVISVLYKRSFLPFEWLAAHFTDVLIAASPSEKKDFEDFSFLKRCQQAVLSLNVDTTKQSAQEPRSIEGKPEIVVAGCGRIARQKQTLLFCQVAALMQKSHPHLRFLWIGEYTQNEEESEAIKAFLERESLENFSLSGWVDNATERLHKADLFLMLSRYESFGYVTADAMLAGLPVVGTPVTGTVDLVKDGETGFLCPPEVPAIVAALTELLENPDRYQQMSEQSIERIQNHFSLEKMAEALSNVYRQALPTKQNH